MLLKVLDKKTLDGVSFVSFVEPFPSVVGLRIRPLARKSKCGATLTEESLSEVANMLVSRGQIDENDEVGFLFSFLFSRYINHR